MDWCRDHNRPITKTLPCVDCLKAENAALTRERDALRERMETVKILITTTLPPHSGRNGGALREVVYFYDDGTKCKTKGMFIVALRNSLAALTAAPVADHGEQGGGE